MDSSRHEQLASPTSIKTAPRAAIMAYGNSLAPSAELGTDPHRAAAPLEPPTVNSGTETSPAAPTARVSLNPRAAPTLGLAAHPLNGDSTLDCPLPTAALPSTCPLSNIVVPAAAALNGSTASSPSPLVAPRLPMTSISFAVSFSPLSSATAVPSLKTTAPPLLDTKTVLPCSKVDESAAVQQSQPAVTAAARGGMQPLLSSPTIHVPPCLNVAETVPAAAGIFSPMSSTGIFIGNVPLHTHGSDFSCDKFAASFNNSTRKTLSYVNPSIQNGEIVVRPSIDIVRDGSGGGRTRRWGIF
ncbi:UNVERIFIED_CONTAM: hypothetical protein Sangu_3224000 [Sesamum angustifolium]|uniref:Uncharacterized protein n=1 Tax=Sesamum angustifolium TaxID=2727405 RepID=A0AAW2JHX5_9LAMI